MNILFFSRLFYPHIGGVEKHVLEISRLLLKKGHKVTIVAEQHSSRLKLKENVEGIRVFRIPNLKEGRLKKLQIWTWLWNNRKLITGANVVHCHDVFFWYLPFRFLFPFKKIFTTFHGYENYPLKSKDILIHKISEKLSNGNICIGDFIKKWYKTTPTYVSYGGIGKAISDKRPHFAKASRGKQAISENSAVFIGRLDEQTGIKTYANAVKIIRKKIPDFKFEIIGDGKFRKDLEKNFKVLGFKKNASELFRNCNFAFVSRYLSILEAMAAERLVFAVYDNPLKEDYLRMTPFSKFIIICNSPSELVSKISFYLQSRKEKEKMINNAYSWVRKQTWEEMTNAYLKVWKA